MIVSTSTHTGADAPPPALASPPKKATAPTKTRLPLIVTPPASNLSGQERRAALDALAVSLGAVNKPIHLSDSECVIEGPVRHVSNLTSIAPFADSRVSLNARGESQFMWNPPAWNPVSPLSTNIIIQTRFETYWQYQHQNVALLLPEQVTVRRIGAGMALREADVRRGEEHVVLGPGLARSPAAELSAIKQIAQAVFAPAAPFPSHDEARVFKLYFQWPPQPLPTHIDEAELLERGTLSIPLGTTFVPLDYADAYVGATPPQSLCVTINGQRYAPLSRTLVASVKRVPASDGPGRIKAMEGDDWRMFEASDGSAWYLNLIFTLEVRGVAMSEPIETVFCETPPLIAPGPRLTVPATELFSSAASDLTLPLHRTPVWLVHWRQHFTTYLSPTAPKKLAIEHTLYGEFTKRDRYG